MMIVMVMKWSLVIGCEDGVKGEWVKTRRHQLCSIMTTIKIYSEWSEGEDLQRLVASVEVFQPHRRRKDEPEGEL